MTITVGDVSLALLVAVFGWLIGGDLASAVKRWRANRASGGKP